MKELLVFDCNNKPTSEFYNKLKKEDKEIVDKFEKYCLISASPTRAKKSKSNAIRFLLMVDKKTKDINLEDLQNFLRILKEGGFSDYYKNDVKGYVQRFLRWHFKDWSARFNNFEDIKYNSDPQRKKKINPEDVLTKEDVEKLAKAEKDIFWKAFLLVQYEGALRTIETRTLKWDMIDTEDSDIYWLTIQSKKNKNATDKERTAPPLSQAVYYLNELKKQVKSPYVFPSRIDINKPVSSGTTNKWFSRLTEKVLGKHLTNYLLRHSEGEELHKLLREGKLSKENAISMMGHSERMFDKTYSHANKKQLKELLKKQVLNVDYIPPEKKTQMEKMIEEQNKIINHIQKQQEIQKKMIGIHLSSFDYLMEDPKKFMETMKVIDKRFKDKEEQEEWRKQMAETIMYADKTKLLNDFQKVFNVEIEDLR